MPKSTGFDYKSLRGIIFIYAEHLFEWRQESYYTDHLVSHPLHAPIRSVMCSLTSSIRQFQQFLIHMCLVLA
jgi:hypothetical protein